MMMKKSRRRRRRRKTEKDRAERKGEGPRGSVNIRYNFDARFWCGFGYRMPTHPPSPTAIGGPTVVQRWSNVGGPTEGGPTWSNGGPTVVQRWSNRGPTRWTTVVQRWSNGGPTWVVQRWSNVTSPSVVCAFLFGWGRGGRESEDR